MPKYARKRRSSKRRYSRRIRRGRAQRRSSRTTVARARTTLLPDRFFVRLRYSEQFGLTALAGVAGVHQFAINSIYDPNITGTGHQPLGHDQWATLYNRYRVRGLTYMITFTNFDTSYQYEVAVQTRPNSTVDNDMSTIREDPQTRYKAILGVEGSGQAIRIARGYASVVKVRGTTSTRVNAESDYQAVFGNNPPIIPVLNIFSFNQDATAGGTIRVRVDLIYHCEFFDRKIQYQS